MRASPAEQSPASPTANIEEILRVDDFEPLAAARLTQMAYDYYRSGAWSETTLRENVDAWSRLHLYPRSLVDVSKRSTATRLLGLELSFPLLVAPTAMQKMCCSEGECASARAAAAAGVPLVLSSLATCSVEEVCGAAAEGAAAGGAAVIMQIYCAKDRGFTRSLIERAAAAGCRALMLTVDTPTWGMRERDVRNHFCVPQGMRIVNLERGGEPTGHSGRGIGESLGWTIDAALTWKDLEMVVKTTSLPVLVKGVMRGDDAVTALDHGAAAIVVSNHGGRQLDGAAATCEALGPIVDAVAGRAPVLVDGGIRRGVDILRAIALGAAAVQVGRPVLWGLAAAGQAGVARILELLRSEFDLAMALAGCPHVRSISRALFTA